MSDGLLTMGGYAQYIWPAYGLAVVALVALLVGSVKSARRYEDMLKQAREARGD